MKAQGSVLLLVVFVCAGVAVLCASLAGALLACDQLTLIEADGAIEAGEMQAGLEQLAVRAAGNWAPQSFGLAGGSGTLSSEDLDSPWTLTGTVVFRGALATRTVRMTLERGRDGLDLPLAAVVADRLVTVEGRLALCVDSEAEVSLAVATREPTPPGLLPAYAACESLERAWELDASTLRRFDTEDDGETATAAVVRLTLANGEMLRPAPLPPTTPEQPLLILADGPGILDLTELGERWGVVVASGGSVRLEGTTVHGAVFVTNDVDLGATGCVIYVPSVLRWATDRSTVRVRLVPGSRIEGP